MKNNKKKRCLENPKKWREIVRWQENRNNLVRNEIKETLMYNSKNPKTVLRIYKLEIRLENVKN